MGRQLECPPETSDGLKTELLKGGAFRSAEEARIETLCGIDRDNNRKRLHSALDYLSPDEFEKRLEIAKNEKASKSIEKYLAGAQCPVLVDHFKFRANRDNRQ